MGWTVHWADRGDQIAAVRPVAEAAIERSGTRLETVAGAFDCDLVVKPIPGGGLPGLGFVGYAPTGHLVELTVDPGFDRLADTLAEALERTLAHEFNHVLRWRGVGYGQTLGAALVSEGLAGRFTQELYGSAPEVWEAPRPDDLDWMNVVLTDWALAYDHAAWFFGAADKPAWLGYRLGYRLIGDHMKTSGQSALELTDAPVDVFHDTALRMAA